MCIGKAQGVRIEDGERYTLTYYGRKFEYVAKKTPNGIVLVHDSKIPLGSPMGAVPVGEMNKYAFKRAEV